MDTPPIIISIFGGSGSGKSFLARALEEFDPLTFSRIPADRLIVSKQDADKGYFKRPIRYDWILLRELLSNAKLGELKPLPQFDYTGFVRKSLTSDKHFKITSCLIIDSIEPYPDAHFHFYLDLPAQERQQRLRERDKLQNTNILKHWEWSLISDSFYKERYSAKSYILDGGCRLDGLRDQILLAIKYQAGAQSTGKRL